MIMNVKLKQTGVFVFLFLLSCCRFSSAVYAENKAQDSKEQESFFVAKKALGDGFYDVSLGLLEKFLKNYPHSGMEAEAHLLIGQCYFHQGRYLEALELFEDLLKQPDATDIRDAVLYWIAEVHFKGSNFGKAAGYYRNIIDNYPSSSFCAAAYYSLGWCLLSEGKFEKALQQFTVVEDRYSRDPYVQDYPVKIVECLYDLKDYARLKERVDKYIKSFAKDTSRLAYFYFYKAEASYYTNDYEEAARYYEKTVATSTDVKMQALSKLGIGWSYLKLKKYKEAQDTLSVIKEADLEQSGKDILALGVSLILAQTQQSREAQQSYDNLIASSSDISVILQAYLGKADMEYTAGRYQEAISLYKKALEKVKDRSMVSGELLDNGHYGLAWAYLKTGEFKNAIKEFQQIAKETDDKIFKVSALVQIGDAYQDAGEFRKAQETYDAVFKDYPDSFYGDYVQYQLGVVALKVKQYDAAIMSFQSLKRNFPNSKLIADASYALGLSYFQRQDYNSSRDAFAGFQDEFKDSKLKPQALYLLGSSLYNLGKFTEAVEVFKDIIKSYGNDRDLTLKAEYEIADCFYRMGNENEALARFKSLRSKYPDSSLSAEIMWWLGEYYYRHGKPGLARRYFSALIQDFPDSALVADAYYALGWSYEEESLHDEAVENFKKVLEKDRTDLAGQAAIAIADIYVKENVTDEALLLYTKLIQRHPNLTPVLYPKKADLLSKLKRYDEALYYYRQSLDVVPVKDAGVIQFKIAEALQSDGKVNDAIAEYMKIPYLYSEQHALVVKALLRVARMYEDGNNAQEAIAAYNKIITLGVQEAAYARERIEKLSSMQR